MSTQPPHQSVRSGLQLTADGMPADPGRTPRQVRLAVGLLALVALLAVVSLVLNGLVRWGFTAQGIRQDFGSGLAHETWVNIFLHATGLGVPTYGLFLVFLVKTWRGRSRARTIATVYVAIPLLQVGIPPHGLVESSFLVPWIAVCVVTAASTAFGLVLLWRNPARTWFAAVRAYRTEWGHWPKR